jgi:hypothetical protein
MTKVSFDFDGVLDQQTFRDFAQRCSDEGHTLYIVTSRLLHRQKGHDDLYDVAAELGIPKNHIRFTNRHMKQTYFEDNQDFAFHLDDDQAEVLDINEKTKVKGVWSDEDDWEDQCLDCL